MDLRTKPSAGNGVGRLSDLMGTHGVGVQVTELRVLIYTICTVTGVDAFCLENFSPEHRAPQLCWGRLLYIPCLIAVEYQRIYAG